VVAKYHHGVSVRVRDVGMLHRSSRKRTKLLTSLANVQHSHEMRQPGSWEDDCLLQPTSSLDPRNDLPSNPGNTLRANQQSGSCMWRRRPHTTRHHNSGSHHDHGERAVVQFSSNWDDAPQGRSHEETQAGKVGGRGWNVA
jgi:hypothetical protein